MDLSGAVGTVKRDFPRCGLIHFVVGHPCVLHSMTHGSSRERARVYVQTERFRLPDDVGFEVLELSKYCSGKPTHRYGAGFLHPVLDPRVLRSITQIEEPLEILEIPQTK